jgi:DNA-binding response OmpR family regulator
VSILVVEDDAVSRKLITSILEKHDFTVVAKESAMDAWKYLESGKSCELIVTDVMMPIMDGFALIQKLKANKRFSKLPIILCTSLNDSNSIVKGMKAGVADYVVKPVKSAVLVSKINEALDKIGGAVLVVDDEEAIRQVLSQTIKREGYPVITAESANQALELIERKKIDLVISDIVMPDMDGMELLAKVKERHPKLPVILISGRTFQSRDKILASGADDFIAKPFNNTEIIARIKAFCP